MNSENFKNLHKDSYDINNANATTQNKAKKFLDALNRNASGGQIKSFVEEQGKGAADALENNLRDMATRLGYADPKTMLGVINPRLLAYLKSQSGQGLIRI